MADIPATGPLILIADDEETLLRSLAASLTKAGFRAIAAENGEAALDAFLSAPDEIALVLTDVIMPGMSGTELAERVREIRPGTAVVLMTGYPGAVVLRNEGERVPLLRKPFLREDLIRVVRASLASRTASPECDDSVND